jgi:hypothetical protein
MITIVKVYEAGLAVPVLTATVPARHKVFLQWFMPAHSVSKFSSFMELEYSLLCSEAVFATGV